MTEATVHPEATLSPTKDELCAEFSTITERLGSYRAVDPDGEVGIEVIIGRTFSGELGQLFLSYRAADNATKKEIARMDHSVLGERSVAFGADDRVAKAEFKRIVEESDVSSSTARTTTSPSVLPPMAPAARASSFAIPPSSTSQRPPANYASLITKPAPTTSLVPSFRAPRDARPRPSEWPDSPCAA